jgi:hypothetical protein
MSVKSLLKTSPIPGDVTDIETLLELLADDIDA